MESMILGRQQNVALICAIFVVSASAPAALSETIAAVGTDVFSTGNPSSTVTTPMRADTAPLITVTTPMRADTAPLSTVTTPMRADTAPLSTVTTPMRADTALWSTATMLNTSAVEATTTSKASNSADGSASTDLTTADKSLMAVTATLLNTTESLTNKSTTLSASASDGITNANASNVTATTASITTSQGTSSTNFTIPANGTDSSRTDGIATSASSLLSPTTSSEATLTSPEATTTSPEASSSSAYRTTTSAAVESTAASTTVQSTPTTTVGISTAGTSDSGRTLPMTQIIIVTVSSVVGGILVIIIIIGVVVHCRRRRQPPKNSLTTDIPSLPPMCDQNVPTRSRTVNLADFTEYVNQLSADSDYGFAEEFEELQDAVVDQPITAAKEEHNRSKNRYSNVLPFDRSRVKLHTSLMSEKSDYVNANYIPGHNGPKEFIATQGPLLVTADDFWQMVWEQQCKAIVMLTRCTEGLVDKCYHYWPSGHDPVVYGDVTVQVTDELEQPQWTVTNFSVSHSAKVHSVNADTQQVAGVRHVRHFHFTTFPDHRAPREIESMLQFVRMVRSKLQPAATGGGGPVIVHCSAGVGRTGTFIAIDRLLQQIDEGRSSVDVFGIIREMRMHRMLMVQSEEQYIFIYKIIMHELQKQRNSVSLNGGTDNKAFEDDPVA